MHRRRRSRIAIATVLAVVGVAVATRAPIAVADSQPVITISDTAVVEGASGTTNAVFVVRVSQAGPNATPVDYSTEVGSARSPSDYAMTNGTVVIPPGTTAQTVSIPVKGDGRVEGDENFWVRIGGPAGAAIPDNYGEARIIDDDVSPYVAVGDVTVVEGDSGTTNAVFPVTLSAASVKDAQVRFVSGGGSATSGIDFVAVHGTVVIPAGQTSATISVPVTGDRLDESTYEDFRVTLFSPSGARLAPRSVGFGTILDDDLTVYASVLDTAIIEGNSATALASFDVTLDRASTAPVVLAYRTVDGSAIAGTDYVAQNGTVSFAPGETAKTVKIAVVGDTVEEPKAETIRLIINPLTGAIVTGGDAFAEVIDNDDDGVAPPPSPTIPSFFSVQPTSVIEGQSGTVNATFRVVLQPAPTVAMTVDYATGLGNATPGTDYTAKTGTLTFTAGQNAKTVSVSVLGDVNPENDESLALLLSNATGGATILHDRADAVIRDDDVAPVLSLSPPVVAEGDTGTADAPFVLTLSAPSPLPVTATMSVLGTSYPVTFAPGATTVTIHTPVPSDTVDENDQFVRGDLFAVSGARVYVDHQDATILDDDHVPWLFVDDTSVPEGDAGNSSGTFTVSLTAPSPNVVSVSYSTGDWSGATQGVDYLLTSGTLTFNPGEVAKTVAVDAVGDLVDENDEYFGLFLSSPVGAPILDGGGAARIADDDTQPQLSISDGGLVEADTGTLPLTFQVSLQPPSSETVTVNFAALSSGTFAATPGVDFTAVSGTLTFAPGDTVEPVTVSVNGDLVDELDEQLYIQLTSPTKASILDEYGDALIIDDDNLSGLSVRNATVLEGDSGSTTANFVVSLSPPSPIPVTVNYTTVDSVAVAGSDYAAVSGTLTFTPGQTTKNVPVTVFGDSVHEQDFSESFRLALSNPVGAMFTGADTGYAAPFPTADILNDDAPAVPDLHLLAANDVSVEEGDAGTVNAVFTITLQPASSKPVIVNYSTGQFNARSGVDFQPKLGTLTFSPGQTSKTVNVPVNGDREVDPYERFALYIHGSYGASIGRGTGMGFILDDDHDRVVTLVSNPVIQEGDTGDPTADFTVGISSPSLDPIRLDWYTQGISARVGEDYDSDVGTLDFAPGETTKTVSITVHGDSIYEGEERFNLMLDPYSFVGLRFTLLRGTATIRDDDTSALLGSVTSATGAGQGGVTITRSGGGLPTEIVTTAGDGRFSIDDVPNGRYVLTPSQSGRTFVPASMTVDVRSRSLPSLTFIMLKDLSMSGRVVDNQGRPVPGVTVTRSGGGQPNATATTNGQGYFGFSQVPVGTYTITPTRAGMTFTPASRSVTIGPASAVGVDFTRS